MVNVKQKKVTSLGNSLTASILHMMQCANYFKQKSPKTADFLENMIGEILSSEDKNITNQINFLFNAGLIDDKGGLTNRSKKLVVESLYANNFNVARLSDEDLYDTFSQVLEELSVRSKEGLDLFEFVDKSLGQKINDFLDKTNDQVEIGVSIPIE